jgi:hypothetical protein
VQVTSAAGACVQRSVTRDRRRCRTSGRETADTIARVRFLPDRRLYTDTERCLAWLERLPSVSTERADEECHVYWHGPIGLKQTLVLKSFLATQDRHWLRLTLWLDHDDGFGDFDRFPELTPLLPYLHVRAYDPVEQSRGTPLEDRLDLYVSPGGPTARSNFARLTILHNVGGVYVDTDTVLLRDLYELPSGVFETDEFCSQWSSHVASGNNAFLRLRRGSATAVALMERAVAENSCQARAILAFDGGEDLDILVLPSAFFDPLWACQDGVDRSRRAPVRSFDEFFAPVDSGPRRKPVRSFQDFFPGAFAYHWHNRWDVAAHPSSYFARFERELDAILAGKGAPATPVAAGHGR